MCFLVIIILIIFLFTVYQKDKIQLRGLISPTLCFILPTLIIAILYDLTGEALGFYPCDKKIYTELLIAGLVFYFGSLMYSIKRTHYKSVDINLSRHAMILPGNVVKIVVIVAFILYFRVLQLGGVAVLYSDELQEQYASFGFFGHVFVANIFLFTLLLANNIPKYQSLKKFILLVMLFVGLVFYQVKGWMILPFVIAIIYQYNIGRAPSLIRIGIVGVFVIASFLLGYIFSFSLDDEENRIFLLNHFLKYFYAGVGGWSEAITMHYPVGENPMFLCQPFSDILRIPQHKTFEGYSLTTININGEWTNVYTFIGSIILFGGRFFGYLYILLLGFMSNLSASMCLRKKTPGAVLAYSTFLAALVMGFFGSYFTLLNLYEIIFYCIIYHKVTSKHYSHVNS